MNILYIITMADGGGAQKYVLDMAEKFQGTIAAGSEHNMLFESAQQKGLKHYRLKHLRRNISPVSDLMAFWEIYSLVKQLKPDLVHLNSSKAGFIGSIAAKLAGAKTVFTAHGLFYFYNTPWVLTQIYTILEKFASLFRDFIITVSERDKQNALKHRLINPAKIQNIYYGIKTVPFLTNTEARKQLGLSGSKFIFGNVAQYYYRKGLDILIKSISLLAHTHRENEQFILVGEGPEKEGLQNLVKNLGLTSTVRLTGHLKNAAIYLTAFDVFVLSSRYEGFPYVLLEALQAGLPIVATDVGGNQEMLGPAGVIVPAGNELKLAEALTSISQNQELRHHLIQMSLERRNLFTLEQMFNQTEKIYRSILGFQ